MHFKSTFHMYIPHVFNLSCFWNNQSSGTDSSAKPTGYTRGQVAGSTAKRGDWASHRLQPTLIHMINYGYEANHRCLHNWYIFHRFLESSHNRAPLQVSRLTTAIRRKDKELLKSNARALKARKKHQPAGADAAAVASENKGDNISEENLRVGDEIQLLWEADMTWSVQATVTNACANVCNT